jgi:hypothetical protein
MVKPIHTPLRNGNPQGPKFGPHWPGRRCLARLRGKPGRLCQRAALRGRTRCSLHGGRSTGPKTKAGLQRIRRAHLKHGYRSKAYIEASRGARYRLRILAALVDYLNGHAYNGPMYSRLLAALIKLFPQRGTHA